MKLEYQVESKKRISWLDLAKCFAIFGVLVDHSNRILYNNQVIAYASYFSVSLFIIVMGFTLYQSLSTRKNGVIIYLLKRTSAIVVPYVIATVVCCVCFNRRFDFKDILMHLVHFDACLPYYYVLLYVQLLWISPLLCSFVLKADTFWKEFIVTVAVVLFSVLTTNRSDILGIYGGGGKLFGGTYLVLLCLGMLMSKHYCFLQRITRGGIIKSTVLFSASLIISIIWIIWMSYDQLSFDKSIRYFGGFNPPGISFIVYSILVAMVALYADQFMRKISFFRTLLAALEYVGRNTLSIFLYHIILRAVALKICSIIAIENIWIERIVVYGLMLVGPLIIDKIISHIYSFVMSVYL